MKDDAKQELLTLARKLFAEQNFAAAVIAGAVTVILAAAAYGIVVAKWAFAYGFAAAGIGIIVGSAMQFLGRGISMRFAVLAATYTIAACLLGNFCRAIVELALARSISPIEVLGNHPLPLLLDTSVSYVSLIDLVYWFVAVFAAVFLARRPLSRSDRLAIGLLESRDRA